MTSLNTFLLCLGMATFGAPLILNLLSPLAGAFVTRTLSEPAWDGAMLFFAQGTAALATFLVGLAISLPWYAALIAALLVGITSYAKRAPESLLDYNPGFDASRGYDLEDDDRLFVAPESLEPSQIAPADRDRELVECPECGKQCTGDAGLDMHRKAKHGAPAV